jgi:Mn2+/Fe2+ NRAMP family transporter
MGIRDRDYMKRPSDDDEPGRSSPESRAEDIARRFFQKYPRFFLYFGIALAILIAIALVIAGFSGTGH